MPKHAEVSINTENDPKMLKGWKQIARPDTYPVRESGHDGCGFALHNCRPGRLSKSPARSLSSRTTLLGKSSGSRWCSSEIRNMALTSTPLISQLSLMHVVAWASALRIQPSVAAPWRNFWRLLVQPSYKPPLILSSRPCLPKLRPSRLCTSPSLWHVESRIERKLC